MKLHQPTKYSPPEMSVIKHKSKQVIITTPTMGENFVPVSKIPYLHM